MVKSLVDGQVNEDVNSSEKRTMDQQVAMLLLLISCVLAVGFTFEFEALSHASIGNPSTSPDAATRVNFGKK